MLDFQLFRIKVYFPTQRDFYLLNKTPSMVLRSLIETKPSDALRKGHVWHIGNIQNIGKNGAYFRIGRTSRATIEMFHDGAFTDIEFEAAPYTHVVIDYNLEVCAFARKTRLSQYTSGIANQLQRLLNRTENVIEHEITCEVSPISDPNDLICYLKKSVMVKRFWISLSRPNPFDIDNDFGKPMQRVLSETGGSKAKVDITSETGLDPKRLIELTRSAAATGEDAAAFLKPAEDSKFQTMRLKGNSVTFKSEVSEEGNVWSDILERLRGLYRKIREGE
jgi:hypothetical protein